MIIRLPICQTLRTFAASVAILLLLVLSVGRGDSISTLRLAAGAHEQDLVRWELTHFMDKWLRQAMNVVIPSTANKNERLAAVDEFFGLREEIVSAQVTLTRTLAAIDTDPQSRLEAQAVVDALEQRRGELQGIVEETLEAAISHVVDEQHIIERIGPLRWPPVDFTFEDPGLVLIRSPRDRIKRLDDLLLDPGVNLLEQVELEHEVESGYTNTSALVVRIGGVATYPAQVSPNRSLHGTLELAAHEWLHHWLIFKPLGKKWFAGGELQSINETVANIFSQEIGDLALMKLTDVRFERKPWVSPTVRQPIKLDPDVFDLRSEMRKTRADLEGLLNDGLVDEAEKLLEDRRLEFLAHGHYIRKLNNAWFAFNGTYTDGIASISPIEGQLRAIRTDSGNLAAFLERIAVISEEGDLQKLALEAGWEPLDSASDLPIY